MKRPLTWLVVGVAALGIGVPAYAAVQSNVIRPTPDDNGVPGELRGNCDEAEHASDPECAGVAAPTTGATTPTTATTVATTAATNPVISVSVPDVSTPDVTSATAPSVSSDVTGVTTDVSAPGVSTGEDISGPCDEAEHANDPRCTGATATVDDHSGSGRGGDDDSSDDSSDDSGRGRGRGGDDSSDDDSGDDSGHGGHGSDD